MKWDLSKLKFMTERDRAIAIVCMAMFARLFSVEESVCEQGIADVFVNLALLSEEQYEQFIKDATVSMYADTTEETKDVN